MKKFFGFIVLLFLINSCNDGDVAVQDISFESVGGLSCGNLTYKIKGNEVLILNIAAEEKAFQNDQTLSNAPKIYIIGEKNSVTYRAYNGVPTGNNFCGALPPASPIVIEEWTAISGTIEVSTTLIKTITETTNAETITGYNHLVLLKNITFKKPNGEQFYEEFRFGNYKTDFPVLNFTVFTEPIEKCSTSNILTSKNGSTSLISFDNTNNLIQNTVTTTGNPRVGTISATNNLYYRVFSAINLTGYKCAASYLPADYLQEWKAISGTVEVTTTQSNLLFIHKVRLKSVKLKKGNSEFSLGNDFSLGEIQTQ